MIVSLVFAFIFIVALYWFYWQSRHFPPGPISIHFIGIFSSKFFSFGAIICLNYCDWIFDLICFIFYRKSVRTDVTPSASKQRWSVWSIGKTVRCNLHLVVGAEAGGLSFKLWADQWTDRLKCVNLSAGFKYFRITVPKFQKTEL